LACQSVRPRVFAGTDHFGCEHKRRAPASQGNTLWLAERHPARRPGVMRERQRDREAMQDSDLERGAELCPCEEGLFQDNPFLLGNTFGVGWLLPFFVLLTSGATSGFTLPRFTLPCPPSRCSPFPDHPSASGPLSPFQPHAGTLAGIHPYGVSYPRPAGTSIHTTPIFAGSNHLGRWGQTPGAGTFDEADFT